MKLGVLVYIEDQGRVLMLHRLKKDEHLGLWLAPGGKLEPNESPWEAAIREVKEETGLIITQLSLRGVLTFPDLGDSPFGDEWTVFVFHAVNPVGALIAECSEGHTQWIAKDQLLNLPMWEGDRLFTPKIFTPTFFTGKLLYRGHQFIEAQFWPVENPS